MLTAQGNPLVSGMAANTTMANRKLKVLRAFYIGTKVQKIGDTIEAAPQLAAELVNAYKAEYVKEELAKVAPPKEKA
jgi:uncharacterized protein involved in exopolysaccharide biosynthesis